MSRCKNESLHKYPTRAFFWLRCHSPFLAVYYFFSRENNRWTTCCTLPYDHACTNSTFTWFRCLHETMPRISRFGKHTFTKSFPNGFLNTGSLVEHGNWLMTHSHEFWWWFECLQTCRRLSVARGRCILSCLARITKLLCIEVVNIDCTKGLPLGLFCIINHTTKSALTSKFSERGKIGLSQKQEKKQGSKWSAKSESKLHVWQANNNACAWFFSRPHPLVV